MPTDNEVTNEEVTNEETTVDQSAKYAVKQTIMNETWYVPLSYHTLSRFEYDIDTKQVVATFASYFNQDSKDRGASPLDYTTIIVEGIERDYSDVVGELVAKDGHKLSGGEVVA